ncbi:MAG: hypothetical protein MRY77_01745 [Rhodobacteraceae bacterium]|nr:hypothetical protein [Paracoccaceae bacterium]
MKSSYRAIVIGGGVVGFTNARQERDGLLLGVHERNPKHWNMDGAPWDYGIELIPEDIDRINEDAGDRFLALSRA